MSRRCLSKILKKRSSTKFGAYASLVDSAGICALLSADVFYGFLSETWGLGWQLFVGREAGEFVGECF